MASGAQIDPQALSPAEHTSRVCAAFGCDQDRLTEVMAAAVTHLHAFATEVHLTREEWMSGVRFLTAVGQRCDDTRQEFILLSDTLGLSMLVEMLAAPPAPGATEPTVLGPFYVADAADYDDGSSIVAADGTGGEPLLIGGHVRDINGASVAGATVDMWQVQPDGRYDIEGDPAARNLRGRFRTRPDGGFRFRTVRPVDYTIPDDGPVGALLRACGRDSWRPAHIHFSIRAAGYEPLVTHLFDAASPYLGTDAVFAVRSSLVTDMAGPNCKVEFVLQPAQA